MIGINQVIGSVISGCAVSCGAVLVVAGASKLYRGLRGLDEMTAIRRALRMPRRQWRLFSMTAGGVECVVGALVCSGAYPMLGGASLAALTRPRREPEFVRAPGPAIPRHGPERSGRAVHRREHLVAGQRAQRGARVTPQRPAANGSAHGPGQAQQDQDS